MSEWTGAAEGWPQRPDEAELGLERAVPAPDGEAGPREEEGGLGYVPVGEPALEPQPEPPPGEGPAAPEERQDDEGEDGAAAEVPSTVVPAEHASGRLGIPDGYEVLEGFPVGERRTVGVVVGRFNGEITSKLLASALEALEACGVSRDAVLVMPVPGAFELPIAAMALAKSRRYACVVALGCVIRGETPHFDLVAGEAASGLQLAAIETGVPVSFGVLTTDTVEQAEARVEKGAEAVRSALEMADLFTQLRATAAR